RGGAAGERKFSASDSGDEPCDEHGGEHTHGSSYPAAKPLRSEREHAEQRERRQQRPGEEEEPRPRVLPREREPAECERRVGPGEPGREVPERQDRNRESESEAGALAEEGRPNRERREAERPAGRVEG